MSKSYYFARGHLSPDADFLTEMEADATYQYVNVVPQWQAFNNGNWKVIMKKIFNHFKKKSSKIVYVLSIVKMKDKLLVSASRPWK